MLDTVKASPTAISGHLEAYSGQETEGWTYWTVAEQSKSDLSGLNAIKKGDLLTVYNADDFSEVLWKGEIDYDRDRNLAPMPDMGQVIVQQIGGTIVDGIPKGIDPDTWMGYFRSRLPCTLERAPA